MKSTRITLCSFASIILLGAAFAQASTVTGTVTNKTTGKPAAGDTVELVDVQAGMKAAAHATTDAGGHYSLDEPGSGPYLIRVIHQGAGYFIAAPPGAGPGNITVFDTAAKVDGVSIEDDVLQIESENGQLDVAEQYVVHNTSSPRVTQFSKNTFEFALPAGAILDGAEATRPSGLPTNAIPLPLGEKEHYTLNIPIQPDEGDNPTLFVLRYHVPYSGKYEFSPKVMMPVENFAVQLPKGITFTAGAGVSFQPVQPPQQGPSVQTFLAKNVMPGKPLDFSVSGTGSLPRENQGAANGEQPAMGGQDASAAQGNQPGGGIGNPIGTPDPLSKYKWWILGGLGLLLAAAAAFLLRKPVAVPVGGGAVHDAGAVAYPAFGSPAAKHSQLLGALKEELFALESEKISGSIAAADYAKVKDALETVLKRALNRK
jgi:Carboxypeptidase regulatory-like domain